MADSPAPIPGNMKRDMNHSNVWSASYICRKYFLWFTSRFVLLGDSVHFTSPISGNMDFYMPRSWLIFMCEMTRSCNSFLRGVSAVVYSWECAGKGKYGKICNIAYFTAPIPGDLTWLMHVWHDSCVCGMAQSSVKWLIHMWRDSFMCVTWLLMWRVLCWRCGVYMWRVLCWRCGVFYCTNPWKFDMTHTCVTWFVQCGMAHS